MRLPRAHRRPFALILLVSLMLSACGFHLRGEYRIDQDLLPLYIEVKQDAELRNELRLQLAASDIALTGDASQAVSRLLVDRVQRGRRVLSVDSRGRAREYELDYSMQLDIRYPDGQGGEATKSKALRLSRDLLFDPDSVLAIDNEIETLYGDMRQDAARLILRQLQAVP